MLLKLEKIFDKFANWIGYFCGIVMVLMMLNVFYDVIMRYFFKTGSIGMQELEWHFFSLIILLGLAYTLKEDAHVRVDIIYDGFTPKKKALVNIFGTIFMLLPFALLVASNSIGYVVEAYISGEGSGDPGGLPYRWIIKSMIPFSFFLLTLASIGFIIKNINLYHGVDEPELLASTASKVQE